MKRQEDLISELRQEPSFLLIVLDACRHDALKHIYGEDVECVQGIGSNTQDWFKSMWSGKYDLTYFSSAPVCGETEIKDYLGADHFEVVEVWDIGWDEDLGTVPPENMVELVKEKNANRMAVHFMQPHIPYIGEYALDSAHLPDGKVETLAEAYGSEAVRKAYLSNLERVIRDGVRPLQAWFDGPIAITADHGEQLGENGYYGHNYPVYDESVTKSSLWVPILRRVPWYECR